MRTSGNITITSYISNRHTDLVNKFKQYGFCNFILRILKAILRKIGIQYESYDILTTLVNKEYLLNIFNATSLPNIKPLTYNDFLLGDKSVFTEQKLKLIQKRFNTSDYHAYGIIENKRLVYSCWIYIGKDAISFSHHITYKLKSEECLLLDAYCAPIVRGKGFHTKMNAYRCLKALDFGKQNVIVIVLSENIPAHKVQLKCGLSVMFNYFELTCCGKTFTNFYKKIKHYESQHNGF